MGILSALSQTILRSVFLTGERGCRRCPCWAKLPILAFMVLLPYILGPWGSLASSSAALYLYLITAPEAIPAALLISAMVTTWFSATGALTAQLLGGGAVETGVTIALRTLPLSLAGQAAILCFSPWAAGNILSRLSPTASVYPMLVWRLAPQALSDATLAMEVQAARGRGLKEALSAALTASMDRRDGILLANLPRLRLGARRGLPPPRRSPSCLPLLLALAALTLIGLL